MPSLADMGRVVIAGGSGFLGLNLARWLAERGAGEVVVLSRSKPPAGPWQHEPWDARSQGAWAKAIDGAGAVVNLAGRSVDCIKTPLHCDQILRSRVEATRAVGEAVRTAKHLPRVWVQMSTAHRYGDSELMCDEDSAFGYGLAPTVGAAWEQAFDEGCPKGIRRVVLRTSFVLGRFGGALSRLAGLARWGLGGTIARGTQGMSWIHETDMNRLFEKAITDDAMQGAYIASAPNAVSNRVFMRELRRAIGAPFGLPAAGWMVKLGAPLVLRTDPELALYGRYVVSKRLAEEGFEFGHADLAEALADLLKRA